MNEEMERYWKELETDPAYITAGIVMSIQEEILGEMKAQGINKKQLAYKIGCDIRRVHAFFRAHNLSILMIVDVALALGVKPTELIKKAMII
ncbi:MAG: helix-turn-helix transcriptional regulator [Calditrichaeota bacterium]|nr:helix-turn-helix transcriptional regulator [Calditrichota bacterium]